jgi:divalent metal cation (Fe/Co/Zn/Cd) transporter
MQCLEHRKANVKAIINPEPFEPAMWAIATVLCAAIVSFGWLS